MKLRHLLRTTYWAGFFFSLQVALTIYVNSSFLETKLPENLIGLLYTASAVLSMIGLYAIPRLIARFGSSRVLGLLILANIGNLIGIIISDNPIIISGCFIMFFAWNTLIYLGLDIMIEHWSSDTVQGSVRGAYLTSLNIGYMIAPLFAGFIADRLGFGVLYGFALVMTIPVFIIIAMRLPAVSIAHPSKLNMLGLARKFMRHPELGSVFAINFILQFFYAWMVIYGPIYLHEYAGIPWDTLGILFTIMLAAFVLFQYPVGKLCDRFGEKPFMITGLLIMGTATLFFARAPMMTLPVIAAMLFVTRIGASMIEVSTESYFFRRVNHNDVGTIGFFRNTYPFAYIIAPILASGILVIAPTKLLFTLLGIICILAVFIARNIQSK